MTYMDTDFLQIGRTTKVHGASGELRMIIDEFYVDSIEAGKFIFIEQDGKPVPFLIENVRGAADPIVKLEWIDTPEDALQLTSKAVFLNKRDLSEYKISTGRDHDLMLLVGFDVVSETGERIGTITSVVQYPQQLMAHVESAQNNTHLIPLHPDLIEDIDMEKKVVTMQLPEGILDL